MIAISQLALSLNKKSVLDQIDMRVGKGEIFGLTGPNGSGKSLLLKVLATIMKPDRGKVRILDYDIVRDVNRVRRITGYMPDDPAIDDRLSVAEHLEFFYSLYKGNRKGFQSSAEELLHALDINGLKQRLLSDLSCGQRQMVSLARTVIHDPFVILLDNPETGMDRYNRDRMKSVIHNLSQRGRSIVVASGSVRFLNDFARQIGVLHEGCLKWTFPAGAENQASVEKRIEDLS